MCKASNIIYVDQPTGTGFSYSKDLRDLRFNEKGVSNDLYDFLQVQFTLFFIFLYPSEDKNVTINYFCGTLIVNQLYFTSLEPWFLACEL